MLPSAASKEEGASPACAITSCDRSPIGSSSWHRAIGEPIRPQLARLDVELKQAHAATDVGADQRRKDSVGQDGASDRAIFAGMQIRHGRDRLDAFERGDLLELTCSIAFD